MTSKEKAIEALKIGDKVRIIPSKDMMDDWYNKTGTIKEITYTVKLDGNTNVEVVGFHNNDFELLNRITHPTLDDAIKVVEEMKNNPNNNFMTMKQVLTALKGLKEGKE